MVKVTASISADMMKSITQLSEQIQRPTVPCYVVQECENGTFKVVYYDSTYHPDVIHTFNKDEREQAYQIAGDLQAALPTIWGVDPMSEWAWDELRKPKSKVKVRIKGRV